MTEEGTHLVTLSWSFEAQEGLDCTFTVERAEEDGEFAVIAEGLTETRYTDSTAVLCDINEEEPEMKVYTYRVSAVCGEAMGEAAVLVCNEENMPQGFANTLAATVNAPYNLIQATDGMDNIIVWQFNYTTYANNPLFVIEKKDAGSKQFVKIGETTLTEYRDTGVSFNLSGETPELRQTTYRVKAIVNGKETEYATYNPAYLDGSVVQNVTYSYSGGEWSIRVSRPYDPGQILMFYRRQGENTWIYAGKTKTIKGVDSPQYDIFAATITEKQNAHILNYGEKKVVTCKFAPDAPTDLTASYDGKKISLSWKTELAYSASTSCTVERYDEATDQFVVLSENRALNFYDDTDPVFYIKDGIPTIRKLKYRVKQCGGGFESEYSVFEAEVQNEATGSFENAIPTTQNGEWNALKTSWNGFYGASKAKMFYREVGASEWMLEETGTEIISGLTAGHTYELYVGDLYQGVFGIGKVWEGTILPPKPRTPTLMQSVVSEREGVRVDDIWTKFNNYTDERYLTGWRLYRKVDEGEIEYVADVEQASYRTSYFDKNVLLGHRYTYYLQTLCGNSASELSEPASILVTIPNSEAPNKVQFYWSEETGVHLTWKASKYLGAEYVVERKAQGENDYTVLGTVTANYFDDRTAQQNTEYSYRIYAVFNGIKSQATVKRGIPPILQETLTIPEGIRAVGSYDPTGPAIKREWDELKVSWNRVGGASNYEVRWHKVNDGEWNSQRTNETVLTIANLEKGAYYEVQVRALENSGGNSSAWSDTVTGKVAPEPLKSWQIAKPRIIKATNSVELVWERQSYRDGWKIYRQKDHGKVELIGTLNDNVYSFTDRGLTSGWYIYWIVGVADGIEGERSAPCGVCWGTQESYIYVLTPESKLVNDRIIAVKRPEVMGAEGECVYEYKLIDNNYQVHGSVVYNGETFYGTCPKSGVYAVSVTVTDTYDGEQQTVYTDWYRAMDYKPLSVQNPQAKLYNNNRGFVVNKPVISGGSGNYTLTYYLYDNSFNLYGTTQNNGSTIHMDCPNNGAFVAVVSVYDNVTGESANVTTEWFNISCYEPLTVQTPSGSLSADGKGFTVNKPVISGGSGDYTISYYLYDSSFRLYGACPYDGDVFYMNCPTNGLYTANVIVTDNRTGENVQVNAGWYNITGYYAPMAVENPAISMYTNKCGFAVVKPKVTGGSGSFTYTYYLYDSDFKLYGACPYDDDVFYMNCPANGAYVAIVIVTDNVTGESRDVASEWVAITGYYKPLTAENPTGALYADRKGFTVNKPVVSGGSGSYSYAYYLYDDSFTLQGACPYDGDVFYMNCAANGLYTANVIVTDNATGESIWVNAGWYNITGYSAPLTVGKPNAVITDDACGFLVFKPEITGGSGQYAITYCLYDDSFTQHAAYPYNVDVCYMGCLTNGAYVSTVFVSDLVTGENVAVSTDWFGITGH